jgi:acyl-CoA dehydrogenase
MIHLELPRRLAPLATQAAQVADEMFRPISRRYDRDPDAR